jgi:hypothetical protein
MAIFRERIATNTPPGWRPGRAWLARDSVPCPFCTASDRRSIIMCISIFSESRAPAAILCPAALRAGAALRGGAVKMAASVASATCCPDAGSPFGRPTGSARGAGASPHARAPTASSVTAHDKRECRQAARCRDRSACGQRTCGGRRCHRRLLRLMRQTALPRHLPTPKAKLMARVGEELPVACAECGGDIRTSCP